MLEQQEAHCSELPAKKIKRILIGSTKIARVCTVVSPTSGQSPRAGEQHPENWSGHPYVDTHSSLSPRGYSPGSPSLASLLIPAPPCAARTASSHRFEHPWVASPIPPEQVVAGARFSSGTLRRILDVGDGREHGVLVLLEVGLLELLVAGGLALDLLEFRDAVAGSSYELCQPRLENRREVIGRWFIWIQNGGYNR